MKFLKSIFFLHPFLFAIFPILFLYSHNIEKLSFSNIYISFLLILPFCFFVIFLSKLFSKDSVKCSLISSFILLFFFSYGYVMEAIYQPWLGCKFLPLPSHKYLLSIWLILLFSGIYLIKKTKKDLFNLNKIVTVVAISQVFFPIIKIVNYEIHRKAELKPDIFDFSKQIKSEQLHDIYYIILDGYTSSENLIKFYNFNNVDFINSLKKSGFYVPENSHCNYSTTYLSLASSLNMEYINYLTERYGKDCKDWKMPYNMVTNNKVMYFLKSKGYQFLHFSSRYDATDYNKNADINYSHTFLDNFSILFVQTSIIRAFVNIREYDLRNNILYTFSELSNIYKQKENKFILAHIACPRFPYIFDNNGKSIKKSINSRNSNIWTQKENYINQLVFINHKIETLIKIILTKSKNLPIIIIQGDHGTASEFENPSLNQANSLSLSMIQERMGIFNAYYLPENVNPRLYDSITPVNTFRLIFNSYFQTNFKQLEDNIFFSHYDAPFNFIDVTDKIYTIK